MVTAATCSFPDLKIYCLLDRVFTFRKKKSVVFLILVYGGLPFNPIYNVESYYAWSIEHSLVVFKFLLSVYIEIHVHNLNALFTFDFRNNKLYSILKRIKMLTAETKTLWEHSKSRNCDVNFYDALKKSEYSNVVKII